MYIHIQLHCDVFLFISRQAQIEYREKKVRNLKCQLVLLILEVSRDIVLLLHGHGNEHHIQRQKASKLSEDSGKVSLVFNRLILLEKC